MHVMVARMLVRTTKRTNEAFLTVFFRFFRKSRGATAEEECTHHCHHQD